MKNKFLAFTLTEMLVVLVITTIILVASAPIITKKAKRPPNQISRGGQMPMGAIIMFAGQNIPEGWLECNGTDISQPRYLKLSQMLGSKNTPVIAVAPMGSDLSKINSGNSGGYQGSNGYQGARGYQRNESQGHSGGYQQNETTGYSTGRGYDGGNEQNNADLQSVEEALKNMKWLIKAE